MSSSSSSALECETRHALTRVLVFFFQSFLGGLFGPVCEIDVLLNDAENRKTAELKAEDGKVEKHYLFYDGESVSGKVMFKLSNTTTETGLKYNS